MLETLFFYSTDDKHHCWIEIHSFGSGHSQTVSKTASSVGGASAEKADFHDFYFEKLIDKATPKLALACADGTHIDKITVELCRAGADKLKYMAISMYNCIISEYLITGDGEDNFPMESIGVNYGKIQWAYTQQKRAGGGAAGNLAAGWDLEKNCKA